MARLEDRIHEQIGSSNLSANSEMNPEQKVKRIKEKFDYDSLRNQSKDRASETKVNPLDKSNDAKSTQFKKSKAGNPLEKIKEQFQWSKDQSGDYHIQPTEKPTAPIKTVGVEKGASKLVTFLGYTIDLGSQIETFKSSYQKHYVDSRSHNFFLAKFSSVKFGFLQTVLSVLGVSTEELQELQKKALNAAKKENRVLYEQNEYNIEMIILFGNSKKDKGKLKVLTELRNQLEDQMARLDPKAAYTPELSTEIKQAQVETIWQELISEKRYLMYIREFVYGH